MYKVSKNKNKNVLLLSITYRIIDHVSYIVDAKIRLLSEHFDGLKDSINYTLAVYIE